MRFRLCLGAFLAAGAVGASAVLADWPRFRGPNGSGIAADDAATPVQWSPTKNLKWKVPLPGGGVSCPIVVGDKVFVTSYSGYGLSADDPGDAQDLVRHVTCVDRETGDVLWQKEIPSTVEEDPFSGPGVPQHGYASHTPTSDGKNLYVFFGKGGVLAFDLEGRELWRTSVGTDSDPRRWGSSSSPIVDDGILVVVAGPESRSMIGIHTQDGSEAWRVELESLGMVWGTPALVPTDQSQDVVIGVPNEIRAYDLQTGEPRWHAEAMQTDQFSSSVVVDDKTIYAIEGRGGGSIALKAGGEDDVTDANVIWFGRDSSRFSTPIIYQGRLYSISGGTITCLDAATDEPIYTQRLAGGAAEPAPADRGPAGRGAGGRGFGGPGAGGRGPGGNSPGGRGLGGGRGGRGGFGGFGNIDYSSPVLADGKIYYVTRSGEMYVLATGPEFKKLAVNRITDEPEQFSATPAISDGAIFVRSDKHLYCIAE